MEVLIKASQFLLSISILVILHELGHFTFAKLFNTRVEKFYLFFNPWFSVFKIKHKETEYGLGWLPLGGYVKISGMIDESMDKEQMKQPPQPWEFRSKPTWQRLFIMIGGVLVNFILALFIYTIILFTWGESYLPTRNATYGIHADSLAQSIGLKNGDHIISVDNKQIEDFSDIIPELILSEAHTLQVERNGQYLDVPIPEDFISKLISSKNLSVISPRLPFVVGDFTRESAGKKGGMQMGDSIVGLDGKSIIFFDEFKNSLQNYKNKKTTVHVFRGNDSLTLTVEVPETGLLGIYPKAPGNFFDLEHIQYGFFAAIPAGINKGFKTLGDYIKQFKLVFSKRTKAYKEIGGFYTIGKIFPSYWDWQSFWTLTAFLSIILAFLNLLPIPALDGGHVTFLLYEIVTGRKPGDKFLEYAQIVGMVILLALLVYANGNDLLRIIEDIRN